MSLRRLLMRAWGNEQLFTREDILNVSRRGLLDNNVEAFFRYWKQKEDILNTAFTAMNVFYTGIFRGEQFCVVGSNEIFRGDDGRSFEEMLRQAYQKEAKSIAELRERGALSNDRITYACVNYVDPDGRVDEGTIKPLVIEDHELQPEDRPPVILPYNLSKGKYSHSRRSR